MFGFGSLGRRLVDGVVCLFALLGFVYVPLGHRTGLEHVKAVLSTPAAAAAMADVTGAVLGLRLRILDLLANRSSTPDTGDERRLETPGSPKTATASRGPRPSPPPLK